MGSHFGVKGEEQGVGGIGQWFRILRVRHTGEWRPGRNGKEGQECRDGRDTVDGRLIGGRGYRVRIG